MSGALRRLQRGENSPPAHPIPSVNSTEQRYQMLDRSISSLALLLGPLALLGFAAGALRALSLRPGLEGPRRRALTAGWVLLLLVGGPLWLLAAAALRPR